MSEDYKPFTNFYKLIGKKPQGEQPELTEGLKLFESKEVLNDLPPEAMAYYFNHPVQFIEKNVYGIRRADGRYKTLNNKEVKENRVNYRLEPQTKEILSAIADNDYVTIYSGRGVTKTTSLAFAALWFLFTRENSRVVATGPKFDQLKVTLWREILKWLQRSYINDKIKWSSERIYHVDAPGLWYGNVLTSKDKENISGIHEDSVLWLVDEASNVEEEIIDAIMGGMTEADNKIVLCGNPTKTSGFFYNSFTRDREMWKVLHFSTEDCARKNLKWFSRMQKYPRDSDMYRVNVLGLPPRGNPRAVINLEDCEAARNRNAPLERYIEIGLDPASEGNDLTAIAVRVGMKLDKIFVYPKTKAPEIYHHVIKVVRDYRKKYNIKSIIRIKVDDTGYGNAVRQYLALNDTDNIEVVPCIFGGKCKDNEEYANQGTKMWFGLADIIDQIELPNDDELIEELCSREWEPHGESKIRIEQKANQKTRIGRSPDRADACVLAFAGGPKKIFRKDDDTDSHIRNFAVDWTMEHILNPAFDGIIMTNTLHFAALVLNKDLSMGGMAAIFDFYSNTLWIYCEFYQEVPNPELMAHEVKTATRYGLYTDSRNARIMGNKLMFAKGPDKRPLADVMHREGLHMLEPDSFDEYGAIGLGIKMFRNNKIIIHRNNVRVRQEVDLWQIQTGKLEQDIKGYLTALLLILSELKQRIKQMSAKQAPSDYKPVKQTVIDNQEQLTAWMRR